MKSHGRLFLGLVCTWSSLWCNLVIFAQICSMIKGAAIMWWSASFRNAHILCGTHIVWACFKMSYLKSTKVYHCKFKLYSAYHWQQLKILCYFTNRHLLSQQALGGCSSLCLGFKGNKQKFMSQTSVHVCLDQIWHGRTNKGRSSLGRVSAFYCIIFFCQCLERASGTNLVHNQNYVGTNRKFTCWQIRKKICWPKVSLLIFVFDNLRFYQVVLGLQKKIITKFVLH